jgi:hypothetical protein
MKNIFRCYVCAAWVSEVFAICSMARDTDRAFVVCERCVAQLEKGTHVVHVSKGANLTADELLRLYRNDPAFHGFVKRMVAEALALHDEQRH